MATISSNAIHKKRVPLFRPSKAAFRVPESNSYFVKIRRDQGVLASSQCNNDEESKEEKQMVEEKSDSFVARSPSLPLSQRLILAQTQRNHLPSHSLPKLQKKHHLAFPAGEIIKSELGCFNYYDIIRRKEQMSQRRLCDSQLTRLSSLLSDEEMPIDHKDIEEKETNYDQYDKILMEKEPIIYRRRVFNLKHKADWTITK